MKSLTEIKKAIADNAAEIERRTAHIIELDMMNERRAAATARDFEALKAYREAAHANEAESLKESETVYRLKIEQRILKDNARAALFSEAWPVILKACEKYAGKPYGEKTKEKITAEVHSAGYGFYFDANQLHVYELRNGLKYGDCYEAEGRAADLDGKYTRFITEDNKINVANLTARPYSRYTEDTAAEAQKVAHAIRAYSEATKALEAQRRALCDILPDRIPEPDYIKEYYICF